MNNTPATEERVWAVLAHLSAITLGMGILMPVVGWSEQRRKSKYASFQCLQALGYQSLGYTVWILLVLVIMVFVSLFAVAGIVNAQNLANQVTGVLIAHTAILAGLIGVYFGLPIIAAIACAYGKEFRYPFMGKRLVRYMGYDVNDEWLIEDHEDRWVVAMGHFSIIISLWGMLVPFAAWILQGKRSLFMKFQSIQTLAYQAGVTILFFGAGFIYLFGFFGFIALAGFGENILTFNSSQGMIGLIILFGSLLIAIVIILILPLFHIMGQWAGYRVLKGDDYHYSIVGKIVEKRLAKTQSAS